MKIHIYRKKNKKSIFEKTRISISFKGKNQIPLFMVVREYYNKKQMKLFLQRYYLR